MIWYDISGLYNWHGNFTGIQRVVYSLGKYLNEDKSHKSGFFIFQHGNFVEVSWEDLEDRLATSQSDRFTRSSNSKKARAHIQHHSVMLAKRMAKGSVLEKPLRKVYGDLRGGYRSVAGHKMPHVPSSPFKDCDTVVVVDGNWQFPGFARSIKATKKHTGYKFVHFVNDIVAIKNPALASKGADKIIGDYFKKILPVTDTVLCISESTKNDVSEILSDYVRDADIKVIKLGSDIPNVTSTKKPDIEISKEFILAVGTIEIRKNYLLMYYVYKKAIADEVDLPSLVIVGKRGWMVEDAYNLLTKDPEINKKITIVSGILDAELEWLYANCKFTVFPSFYEGWGIPIAESLARGKLCISSNTSSMPEVGRDLARYVSPHNPQQWLKEIRSLNSEKLSKLEQEIKHSYKAVSWRDAYNDLIRITE